MTDDLVSVSVINRLAAALRRSGHFDADWYLRAYPDVARLGLDPAEHYLKYGARLGRDPAASFSTGFYRESHLAQEPGGANPLLHYLYEGKAARLAVKGPSADPAVQARKRIDAIRGKLLGLGLTRQPLEELGELARNGADPAIRALASRELALWRMRDRTPEGDRAALEHLADARRDEPALEVRTKLATLEFLCHFFLDQPEQARAAHERIALAGEMSPDAMLAWANFQPDPEARLVWINEVLRRSDIPPVALGPGAGLPPYDRLTSAARLPRVGDGPRVTVLLAAYEAATTLPTALRSLQEQTWANLEVVVIDDCSPGPETAAIARDFAARDPRFRLIRMDTNGGAYVARNRGLDETTGEFVTIHDADDWSHPRKIETQVRFLLDHPDVLGCTSEQARATAALDFLRWTGQGTLIGRNVSSFLWRRAPVREALGYWDTVRFSADSEFIRRIQKVFGRNAVRSPETGPLSFQRHSESSIVADEVMGMNGFYFGARRDYLDAQLRHHATARSLLYGNDPARRPFPVAALMRPERKALTAGRHFHVVFAGDFRKTDARLARLIARIRVLKTLGRRVGLIETFDYGLNLPKNRKAMHGRLRAVIDGDRVQNLVYGDRVTCDRLVLLPGVDLRNHRYVPEVTALRTARSLGDARTSNGLAQG